MSDTQILNKYGYPVETHSIETEDGYLLEVYRIPYGRRITDKRRKNNPVIVTHGLLGSAENLILVGPNKSLAYMLADNGYDVWLSNTRGNWHSRKHKTLNPDQDQQYWQFSFNEIGIYDLPATIDYILNKTDSNQLHYVGLSQGASAFFAMCSERPEYNKRITVMAALAPVAILKHFRNPFIRIISPFYRFLERLADEAHLNELPPFISSRNIQAINKALCGRGNLLPFEICRILLSILFEDKEMDKPRNVINLALSNFPAGASAKQVLHYAQIIEKGKFQKYDWGPKENIRRYNSKIPPEYNLKNITAPVALFYGEADSVATKEDVEILAKLLPNVVEMYKVPSKNWNHLDFVWGKNIDILLNNKVIDVITRYNK
ncbi:lipase 1-like [Anoplophora glabripennis]|uniref:lipase 1-like n=1 Tax=Anoplophora glabripennis TaxID=217634 RepID=UPI000873D9A7|nr:lipase 1-like [Anoplophora glabripennis]